MEHLDSVHDALWLLQNLIPYEEWKRHVTEFLEQMYDLLLGDRNRDYGTPDNDYARMALRCLRHPIDIVRDMIELKLNREQYVPKHDNRVDGANYFVILDLLHKRLEITKRDNKTAIEGEVTVGPEGVPFKPIKLEKKEPTDDVCKACAGAGHIGLRHQTIPGKLVDWRCPHCNGLGRIEEEQ